MGEFPETTLPNLPFVTPYSEECLGSALRPIISANLANVTWPSANAAFFYPWRLESPIVIVKGALYNGNAVAGNVDIGVYDSEFNLIVSAGSTAQSGTAQLQEFNITDTTILPGHYWLAVAASSTSAVVVGYSAADEVILSAVPVLSMASALALPNPATPAKTSVGTVPIPLFGFTTETTI